jgi:hypothetical protein
MQFFQTNSTFPLSAAVIHRGATLECVLTGIPPGQERPFVGGVGAELIEIFRQLDEILLLAKVQKESIASVRLYL